MIEVRMAEANELDACLRVRREVFIEGQNVPEDLEVDGLDPQCRHALALDGDTPVGTARLRITAEGQAKVERVAVRPSYQGRGLGHRLMDAIETEARTQGHAEVMLSAQTAVISFYERRGYIPFGPEFMEANIPHRKMRCPLGNTA